MVRRKPRLVDTLQDLCASGLPPDETQFCPATTDDDGTFITVHVLSTLVAVLILILLGLLVVYKYRIWIKLVLYIRCGWRPADVSDDMDIEDKEFDAFLCYARGDQNWVLHELLPRLENTAPHFRICVHDRDFIPGQLIIDNIIDAIGTSRRAVCIISTAFQQSDWCHAEFSLAQQKVAEGHRNYLIPILCDDVSIENLNPEMRLYLRCNAYLRENDPMLEDKLRYLMPHQPLSVLREDVDGPRSED